MRRVGVTFEPETYDRGPHWQCETCGDIRKPGDDCSCTQERDAEVVEAPDCGSGPSGFESRPSLCCVCGGPFADGSGCEFCPKVSSRV